MKTILGILISILLIISTFSYVSAINFDLEKLSDNSIIGNTLYVGGSGSNNFTKIQNAIDNASYGDIIFVYSGNYIENVVVDKSINLIGEDRNTTTITWDDKGDIINISAEGVSIQNFTIKDAKQDGIGVYADNTTISYTLIKNNRYGIHLEKTNYNNIIFNRIIDNIIGVNLHASYYNDIENNSIANNFHNGIIISDSFYNQIKENNLSFNKWSIYIHNSGNNEFLMNKIKDGGISVLGSKNIVLKNNIFESSGIRIAGDNVHYWTTHTIEDNYANGKPIYYYKNDHEGTLVPNDAAQVILANCTSIKINNINSSFVSTGILLVVSNECEISETRSDHNDFCGISFSRSNNNMINNCSFSNNEYGVCIWYSSNNTISSSSLSNNNREAIHLLNTNDINIIDNNISNNIQGLYLNEVYHSIISHNRFIKNTWEAIYCHTLVHNTTLTNNIIIDTNGNGIKLYYSKDNIISRNTIYYNGGTGVHISNCYNNKISNNFIQNNTHGISISNVHNSTITKNEIIKNKERGISVKFAYDTQILNNNMRDNNPNAYFQCYASHHIDDFIFKGFFEGFWNSFKIKFDGNYWGRPRLFPVLISGKIISFGFPAWIGDIEYKIWKIDWHPAQESYDIGG